MAKKASAKTPDYLKQAKEGPPKNDSPDSPSAPTTRPPSLSEIQPAIRITHSDSLTKLAPALIKAKGLWEVGCLKDASGYNYDYLSLTGIIEHVKPHLLKNKLCIVQFPTSQGDKRLGVETMLLHESGEYIKGYFTMPIPNIPGANISQMAGGAITYARRYAIAAILGITAEDDTDANYS